MLFEDEGLTGRFATGWESDEPLVFRRCDAVGVSVGPDLSGRVPVVRPRVSNVRIEDCRGVLNVRDTDLRDVTVDGFRNDRTQLYFGNTYERVTLRGRLGSVVINIDLKYSRAPDAAAFAHQHLVDWALDISEVEATELSLRGVPSRLVRRDPRRHGIVTREVALSDAWEQVDLAGSYFGVSIRELARSDWEDVVLVPPARGRQVDPCRRALERLRDAGFAT